MQKCPRCTCYTSTSYVICTRACRVHVEQQELFSVNLDVRNTFTAAAGEPALVVSNFKSREVTWSFYGGEVIKKKQPSWAAFCVYRRALGRIIAVASEAFALRFLSFSCCTWTTRKKRNTEPPEPPKPQLKLHAETDTGKKAKTPTTRRNTDAAAGPLFLPPPALLLSPEPRAPAAVIDRILLGSGGARHPEKLRTAPPLPSRKRPSTAAWARLGRQERRSPRR